MSVPDSYILSLCLCRLPGFFTPGTTPTSQTTGSTPATTTTSSTGTTPTTGTAPTTTPAPGSGNPQDMANMMSQMVSS